MESNIEGLPVVQVRRAGIAPDHAGEHHFFQVGTLEALLEAHYDGDFSIAELGKHGSQGLEGGRLALALGCELAPPQFGKFALSTGEAFL